ncbi:hypothetical protein GOC73_23640 [Sinorhizobium medicae]|nr:hypothetical protein [Sinorhizobium medicae]MDX1083746.1 hypothetical protein [Sinorhizobium medicae]MDX1207501.1 hypothetical protein [Sinorhizobium medicae]
MPITKGAGNPDWTWDETLLAQTISFWLFDVADQNTDYLKFKEQNRLETGPDGHGYLHVTDQALVT